MVVFTTQIISNAYSRKSKCKTHNHTCRCHTPSILFLINDADTLWPLSYTPLLNLFNHARPFLISCFDVTYLFSDFLHPFPQLVGHVTHLQGFVTAEAVEVLLVSHALVQLEQGVPPGHQQFKNHLG